MPGQPQFPGHRPMAVRPPSMPVIGPNGDPIFYHPHYPQLRADICKTCRNVVPIRPLKFAKKLTAEQVHTAFHSTIIIQTYIYYFPSFFQCVNILTAYGIGRLYLGSLNLFLKTKHFDRGNKFFFPSQIYQIKFFNHCLNCRKVFNIF